MPFTPFHLGAALIVKPALNRHFSVITFGIAQVAMDIEPGIRMWTGSNVLHGPTHTILGALVIACLVMLIAPSVCSYLLTKWNKEVTHYKQPWLAHPGSVSRTAVIDGAFFGTLSHVALDSLMHHDIQPLMPFSKVNPLLGLISHEGVYQACTIASVLGIIAWFVVQWANRYTHIINGSVAPELLVTGVPKNAVECWFKELRFTWLWVLLLTVVPSVLFGAAIFSMGVLMCAVLVGVPSAAIGSFVVKGSGIRGLRRLLIMVLVPVLAIVYVAEVDEQIPEDAAPITTAIESFRVENGHYPPTSTLFASNGHILTLSINKNSRLGFRSVSRCSDT